MNPKRITLIPFIHGTLTRDGKMSEPDIHWIMEKWLERHPELKSRTQDIRVSRGTMTLPQPFEDLIGPYLPVLAQTVLLPFKGMIVDDGLMSSYNISFGPGIRRNLNEDCKEAKAQHGVVTSLPMSATLLSPKAPKLKPVPQPPAREDTCRSQRARHEYRTDRTGTSRESPHAATDVDQCDRGPGTAGG